MPHDTSPFIRVATLDELQQKGCIVVRGEDRPIAVFHHDGQVRAVDNRCPHMGFPLSKGTVTDGILTCHWHHARFDLSSGCTFDLFADDVPTSAVEIRNNADGVAEVWVSSRINSGDEQKHGRRRLQEGLAQSIGLIIAKSSIALLRSRTPAAELVREGALFGARYRDGWASGMTILTAMANVLPYIGEEEQFLALYQGLRHVSGDCSGQVPRRDRYPLEGNDASLETLKRWFRYWTVVRHRDAAERTLLTAIQTGASQAELADMMFCAATDRYYSDTGHALDAINKAFELLDIIGWEHVAAILPTTVRQLVGARGGEELNSWRHPIDLTDILERTFLQLPEYSRQGEGKQWNSEAELATQLLAEDPALIVQAIATAIIEGARPHQLSKALCYAAALRIAHFGTANEFGDWVTALHTFTYCNALHQGIKRMGSNCSPEVGRGVFHGAMSIYLDRFLNVPPTPLPTITSDSATPAAMEELQTEFLAALDSQQQVDAAANVAARYLSSRHPIQPFKSSSPALSGVSLPLPIQPLLSTLARGVLREDADFHTFQMLEASIQQYHEWGDTPQGQHILIALARYLAAHSPTQRTQLQTAEIALRLHRGEALHGSDAGE